MYPEQQEHEFQQPDRSFSNESPEPIWEAPASHRGGPGKKWMALTLCACLVVSAAAGFGGGYLAAGSALSNAQRSAATPSAAPSSSPAASAVPTHTASGDAMSVSQVVRAVSGSVVAIETEVSQENFFFGPPVTGQGAGSGVILSEDGYVITNNHVIDGASKVTVRLSDEESYPATLVGTDPVSDIAVIKIDATGLVPVTVGSSAELQVGDEAIAIGNPLGELGGTVTNGIISALNREVNVDGDSMTLLQTNAAINPGNSGGGLFNNRGELVGIVVAKSSGVGVEGLGFAIPIDLAKPAADDLIAHGYVTGRGELGVSILDVKDERTAFYYRVPQMGVYIAEIEDGSAAKKAGLKIGDGITAVDGEKISDAASLKSQIAKHKAGDTFEITVLRDGAEKTVSVTLQESVPEALKAQVAA